MGLAHKTHRKDNKQPQLLHMRKLLGKQQGLPRVTHVPVQVSSLCRTQHQPNVNSASENLAQHSAHQVPLRTLISITGLCLRGELFPYNYSVSAVLKTKP